MASAEEREFGGSVGTATLVVLLPAMAVMLYLVCNEHAGCIGHTPLTKLGKETVGSTQWINSQAFAAFILWIASCVCLHKLLPAKRVHGVRLANGQRLVYFCNAFSVVSIMSILPVLACLVGLLDAQWVVHNFLALQSAATLTTFALSVWLYCRSFRQSLDKSQLSPLGNTGCVPYDFWMGRELNPRVGSTFDLKEFCELTPGLALWLALDLCFLLQQVQRKQMSAAMVCTVAMHAHYVFDALWNEPAILSTMDITSDGFGFMLAFGDLVWVPFTYSLHCRYLLEANPPQQLTAVAAGVLLHLLGYYIFRASNLQKDRFKRNPNHPSVKHLQTLPTNRGKLITNGWWGMSRHPNYLGDWLMGLGWCIACGFSSPVPYFYAIYFASLLMHRERRDEAACRHKHGEDSWTQYCDKVPSRIVPYVY